MTTIADASVSRKRMATYGKSVRKRIPEYSPLTKSQMPDKKETETLESRSPSITTLESESENMRRRYASGSPSSSSPVNANVFDVPSSEDERSRPTPKPLHKPPAKKAKVVNTKKALSIEAEADERRKKVKFSPVRRPFQKPPPSKTTTKHPPLNVTNQAPKQLKYLGTGQGSTIAARPKSTADQRKAESPAAPQKAPWSPTIMTPTKTSRAQSDPDGMDVDPSPAAYISPRGLQIWNHLLEPLDNSQIDTSFMEPGSKANGMNSGPPGILVPTKELSKSSGVSERSRSPQTLPRRRLIDSLVEQTFQQEEMAEDTLSSDESDVISSLLLSSQLRKPTDDPMSHSLAPETPAPAALSSSQGSQSTGPKFTYSRQRSMLSEKDIMQELAFDIPTQPTQTPNSRRIGANSAPALPHLQSFAEEDDDIEGSSGIRSVHELRQAGANNRFLDEIEDLLDRIGTPSTPPSSMRRAGLLDLANNLRKKDFKRKFRANGVEQRLFVNLSQETDSISGFVMISILIALLADSAMPHAVTQLRRHGITKLLIRLLECKTDIIALSKERKTNMSKIIRASISELQEFLLKLPVWESLQPRVITPRTAALKCLELMIRQTREAGNSGDLISKDLTTTLFSILKSAEEESTWDLPNELQAIDFGLALSALESHSITARTNYDESIWVGDYLPIIADILETAMSRPAEGFGLLQVLILRLTLNVTNNSPRASDIFARESLMAVMGQAIVTKFKMVSHFLTEENFSIAMDHLILILGVMINFAEWSSLARERLHGLEGKPNDPLSGMTQLFLDNQARTSEAESVEESQKNVAFGYLSVLLGYLSLLPAIAERVRVRQPRKNIQPLLASIEEFIGHHKTVDDLIEADEDGHNAHTSLTERLESLVTKLGQLKLGECD